MTTRNGIWLVTFGAAVWAVYKGDLAAFYVALAGGYLMVVTHAMEVKINKLLDDRGTSVPDWEIAKD